MASICFFNGTPMEIPEKAIEILKNTPIDKTQSYEDYFEQLTLMEKDLNKYSIGGRIHERTIEKAAKVRGMDIAYFTCLWATMVYTLVKVGRIKDDNENGFLIVKAKEADLQKMFSYGDEGELVCGLCQAPSKLKCGKCGQRYCCKEHQVLDWKKHKKECFGCLSHEEWKKHLFQKKQKRFTTPQRS